MNVRIVNSDGSLRPFERIVDDIMLLALEHCEGRVMIAAKQLRIGRSTFYRKLKDGE